MRIIVNKTKAILSAAVVIFFGGYGVFYLANHLLLQAIVFLAIAIAFGFVLFLSASFVSIDREAVRLAFLGLKRKELLWSDIRELGLIGEDVFSRSKKKSGHKYIYFSPYEMNPDERFQMIVKWPPKDMIYTEYSERSLEYCMSIWGKQLKTYNVEDLYPNTGEPRGEEKKKDTRLAQTKE